MDFPSEQLRKKKMVGMRAEFKKDHRFQIAVLESPYFEYFLKVYGYETQWEEYRDHDSTQVFPGGHLWHPLPQEDRHHGVLSYHPYRFSPQCRECSSYL